MQFLETMGNMITKYSGFFIEGVENTLILSFFTVLFGTILGTLMAMARMSKFVPLKWLATAYIEFFRRHAADGAVDVHLLWSAHDRRDLPHGELYSGLRSLCGGRGRHEPEQLCLCGGGDPFGHSGGGQADRWKRRRSLGFHHIASHDAGHSAPGGAEHSSRAGQ